jgi:hypothetical protein
MQSFLHFTEPGVQKMDSNETYTGERDAFSITEFCDRHGLSPAYFFKLARENRGPLTMRVGRRTLISKEAAAAWRRAMENEVCEKAGAM